MTPEETARKWQAGVEAFARRFEQGVMADALAAWLDTLAEIQDLPETDERV